MDGYGYIYMNQRDQGTIKRIDFYGNVRPSALARQSLERSATVRPCPCMPAEPDNRRAAWNYIP